MGKKILLIEDNEAIRSNTIAILQLSGYEVKGAENGRVGVEVALQEPPDLIISDINMPELDGYGVLLLLSKNPKTSHIPFIFLTSRSERTSYRKGMEMGAADYITKPFDDIELLNAIEIRLKKIETLKKEFSSNIEGVNDFLTEAKSSGKIRFSLNENREIQLFNKKQLIYKEGHYPRYLYLIHKGTVKTYKINNNGKELITAIYKEGDFMGFTALFEGTVYHDNAEALQDVELMVVPKDEFITSISSDLEIARKFIKLLTKDITEKEDQLMSLAYNSLRKRVADGLLLVHYKYKKSADDKPMLEISREDLAQVVGVAKESLIRTLSDFKSEKMIEIIESKIVILKELELKNLPD